MADHVVNICSPASLPVRRRMECATCDAMTLHSGRLYIWYDTVWTCLDCGDA